MFVISYLPRALRSFNYPNSGSNAWVISKLSECKARGRFEITSTVTPWIGINWKLIRRKRATYNWNPNSTKTREHLWHVTWPWRLPCRKALHKIRSCYRNTLHKARKNANQYNNYCCCYKWPKLRVNMIFTLMVSDQGVLTELPSRRHCCCSSSYLKKPQLKCTNLHYLLSISVIDDKFSQSRAHS